MVFKYNYVKSTSLYIVLPKHYIPTVRTKIIELNKCLAVRIYNGRSPFNCRLYDFSSFLFIAKYLFTGSFKNRSIDI